MEFRKFTAADYPDYSSWFNDPQLQRALGPIDEEWLNHILNDDEEGMELAVFLDSKLVAVVGITLPHDQYDYRVITGIGVKPALRNQGLGSKVLLQLLEEVQLEAGCFWVSYVEKFNFCGQAFFEKHEWMKFEEEEMYRYTYSG
ncbi:GNAT family N-acetyltransferase [Neolewinella persica]|uniref:GNAT family N-acetyltransferase n=1 Tax=Neolewinella persica TaxID=70998 RepID=UPI00037ED5D1|nr:GNAT family N-acetyltransferase [Neolewinella persica]